MQKFLQGLSAIVMMLSSWVPTAIVTLIALAIIESSILMKLVVAVVVFNVWHWGGYFLGMFLMSIANDNHGE